jgi:hypothetical protein
MREGLATHNRAQQHGRIFEILLLFSCALLVFFWKVSQSKEKIFFVNGVPKLASLI